MIKYIFNSKRDNRSQENNKNDKEQMQHEEKGQQDTFIYKSILICIMKSVHI